MYPNVTATKRLNIMYWRLRSGCSQMPRRLHRKGKRSRSALTNRSCEATPATQKVSSAASTAALSIEPSSRQSRISEMARSSSRTTWEVCHSSQSYTTEAPISSVSRSAERRSAIPISSCT